MTQLCHSLEYDQRTAHSSPQTHFITILCTIVRTVICLNSTEAWMMKTWIFITILFSGEKNEMIQFTGKQMDEEMLHWLGQLRIQTVYIISSVDHRPKCLDVSVQCGGAQENTGVTEGEKDWEKGWVGLTGRSAGRLIVRARENQGYCTNDAQRNHSKTCHFVYLRNTHKMRLE